MNIKAIRKQIFKLESFTPSDNLIDTYKDFLLHRDYIEHYVFNEKVFESIIDIATEAWNSPRRISRISLLKSLRDYKKQYLNPNDLNSKTKRKLFKLFTICFLNQDKLGKSQISEAYYKIGSLCKHIKLLDDEIIWLIDNHTKSDLILSSILNYQFKSNIISKWVTHNFNNMTHSERRAKLTSWMLNANPNFSLSIETLELDFSHFNFINDMKIKKYNRDLELSKIIEKESIQGYKADIFGQYPELDLNLKLETRRHIKSFEISWKKNASEKYEIYKKDILIKFNKNIELHQSITMLWAIYYSNLPLKQKEKLLINNYNIDCYKSFNKISFRIKSVKLLRWLENRIKNH